MKRPLILFILILGLNSCKEPSTTTNTQTETNNQPDTETEKTLLRYITFYGSDDDYGIELNDDQAFLKCDKPKKTKIEIDFNEAFQLIEEFYEINRIEAFKGTDKDDRQTSLQYLINIYDERPNRYSDDWVDYVIPKDQVANNKDLDIWLNRMQDLRNKTIKMQNKAQ